MTLNISFPDMLLVRQNFPDRRIHDIRCAVWKQMEVLPLPQKLKSGSSIAVGVGSRGIKNIELITRTVIDFFKWRGFQPFIFPAMGSHGGATETGQRERLATRGITEKAMRCPVKCSMDIVETGFADVGIPTFMDRNAFASDGVFLVNRIKAHTDYTYKKGESGILKMLAIGLGKDLGAGICHKRSFEGMNLGQVILSAARQLLSTQKILGGLAILEDGYNNTAKVAALPAFTLEEWEKKLLVTAKKWQALFPVEVDCLLVDEGSKEISGPLMDTRNVINRDTVTGHRNPRKDIPWIGQICLFNVRDDSGGNTMGLGFADVFHARILEKINFDITRKNALTAQAPGAVRLSMFHYPTDRECLETSFALTSLPNPRDVRVGWIKNTAELSTIALSENLMREIKENPNLEIVGPARPISFDAQGQFAWNPFL